MTEAALSRFTELNTLLPVVIRYVVVLDLPGLGDGWMRIEVF